MGKFSNVLLASDFDGTFADDYGNITEDVIAKLQYFISEGGLFTVSTGRTYLGFHKYNPVYINAPVLLCNGAMAYDYKSKKIIFCDAIESNAIPAIDAIKYHFPDVPIEMYPFDCTYAINLNENSERHFTNQNIPFTIVNDPRETKFPWVKAMLCAKEKTLEIQEFLKENNFAGISFLPTTGSYIELLKPGVNKGQGLLKLAESLHISQSDTYAVGDDYNDEDMLKAAAASFVPQNGKQKTKEIADYIVRSNNDGCIANVIEILDTIY
ncbi:MAG: Cof-type HAD-IIB family hydrolase [Clostridia bacterium]|nr:Cof-type HAD-IIB family hydrolase [Clostridia bacterium]